MSTSTPEPTKQPIENLYQGSEDENHTCQCGDGKNLYEDAKTENLGQRNETQRNDMQRNENLGNKNDALGQRNEIGQRNDTLGQKIDILGQRNDKLRQSTEKLRQSNEKLPQAYHTGKFCPNHSNAHLYNHQLEGHIPHHSVLNLTHIPNTAGGGGNVVGHVGCVGQSVRMHESVRVHVHSPPSSVRKSTPAPCNCHLAESSENMPREGVAVGRKLEEDSIEISPLPPALPPRPPPRPRLEGQDALNSRSLRRNCKFQCCECKTYFEFVDRFQKVKVPF